MSHNVFGGYPVTVWKRYPGRYFLGGGGAGGGGAGIGLGAGTGFGYPPLFS